MKQSDNTKKQDETAKTNNGLKSLILRYASIKGWYIGAVNEYLLNTHHVTYLKSDISRIVNDKVGLSPRWILIKEALEHVATMWGRQIGDLSDDERLVATPTGVLVVKVEAKRELETA